MIRVLALDPGWTTTTQAEHESLNRFSELGLRVRLACTHFRSATDHRPPRVAVTAAVDDRGVVDREPGLEDLLADHVTGRSGRAFVVPGVEALDRIVTAGTLVSTTRVDDVIALGGAAVPDSARIDTQDHVRPEFIAGRLVLRVRPALGDLLVPFEQPHPTPCCADHR